MKQYYEANKRRWNELVGIHAKSSGYDVVGFLRGKSSLHAPELDALPLMYSIKATKPAA